MKRWWRRCRHVWEQHLTTDQFVCAKCGRFWAR